MGLIWYEIRPAWKEGNLILGMTHVKLTETCAVYIGDLGVENNTQPVQEPGSESKLDHIQHHILSEFIHANLKFNEFEDILVQK